MALPADGWHVALDDECKAAGASESLRLSLLLNEAEVGGGGRASASRRLRRLAAHLRAAGLYTAPQRQICSHCVGRYKNEYKVRAGS